jgi:uncharacterized membrane protein YkvA (DUF1232 family)
VETIRPFILFLLMKRISKLGHFLKDKKQPFYKKALIIFGIIYLINPIDLIPFPVLGFSLIDDLVIWIAILTYLGESLDRYDDEKNDKRPQDLYKNKTIIDTLDYEVKTDDDKE